MKTRKIWLGLLALCAAVSAAGTPADAQQQQKPNILFIMGDDIGCRASITAD
jgi:arylsulfatase